jgi:hypothetical protein
VVRKKCDRFSSFLSKDQEKDMFLEVQTSKVKYIGEWLACRSRQNVEEDPKINQKDTKNVLRDS